MLGLTQLGIVHTAISLMAVAAGMVSLFRDKEISARKLVGKLYILTTVLTCLTGFGIFQHGGFGKAHVLGVITLVVLAVAAVAGRTRLFGGWSSAVEAVSYSATFFFHMIPGVTETATRLPVGAPLAASQESPGIQAVVGLLFLVFLAGAYLQVRRLRPTQSAAAPVAPSAGETA